MLYANKSVDSKFYSLGDAGSTHYLVGCIKRSTNLVGDLVKPSFLLSYTHETIDLSLEQVEYSVIRRAHSIGLC